MEEIVRATVEKDWLYLCEDPRKNIGEMRKCLYEEGNECPFNPFFETEYANVPHVCGLLYS